MGQFHVLSEELVLIGMLLFKYLSVSEIDNFITVLAEHKYGNLSKYGIHRPTEGPFYLKEAAGRSPVINVGTVEKIRSGVIKVVPAISCIKEEIVVFENGVQQQFDAIVFATGYKSTAKNWLKDYGYVLNEEGLPKNRFPDHWKGENGLYCAGLSRMGLFGVSSDAKAIGNDIKMAKSGKEENLNWKGENENGLYSAGLLSRMGLARSSDAIDIGNYIKIAIGGKEDNLHG